MTTKFEPYINSYTDTRGLCSQALSFSQTILKGIADGGGLFVPRTLPKLSMNEITSLANMRYADQAAYIYKRFGVDIDDATIDALMDEIYGEAFDCEQIAPVRHINSNTHVLELWHGPTSAFKDMALQCLPVFFSAAIEKNNLVEAYPPQVTDYLILVATSGDTGKAALEGFKDLPHTSIIVFYPSGGVSDIQRLQMTTQRGNNLGVFGVEGNFDDCQGAVKAAFSDPAFNAELLKERSLKLSSANSINWGRLLPQIVYYVSAYAQMLSEGALTAGKKLDICVPTGNFGNILGAYYAKEIGVPIGRLFCASNENHVLADFINSGVYDISKRDLVLTPSPSMDILVSNNLERQLFELTGRRSDLIQSWMEELKTQGCFKVDKQTFARLRENFSADWVSNDECLATVKEVFERYDYLIDPHTAVAWKVAERLRGEDPVLIVSTAHWAKFGADVLRALQGKKADEPLVEPFAPDQNPTLAAGNFPEGKVTALIEYIANTYLGDMTDIPQALRELGELEVRFSDTVTSDVQSVEAVIKSWLAERK